MIYYFIPYAIDGRLGKAYNDHIKLVPDEDDWICIRDGDTAFLTSDWGHQMQEIITKYPKTGLFTCYASRTGSKSQRRKQADMKISDIKILRRIAKSHSIKFRHNVKKMGTHVSGYLMLFKKSTWTLVGGFKEDKQILGIDVDFGRKVVSKKMPMMLMQGIFLFHYYRMNEGMGYKKHLRV